MPNPYKCLKCDAPCEHPMFYCDACLAERPRERPAVRPDPAPAGGGLTNYYLVKVAHPQRKDQPAYQAECEDIIRALKMNFDEGNIFKALWRSCAARAGNAKPGHDSLYDAEKILHYAEAVYAQELERHTTADLTRQGNLGV